MPAPRRPPYASFLSFPPNLTLSSTESLCLSFGLYTNGSRQDVLFYVWLLHSIGLVSFIQIIPGCSSLGSLSLLISKVSQPLRTSWAGSFFVCPVRCMMLSSVALASPPMRRRSTPLHVVATTIVSDLAKCLLRGKESPLVENRCYTVFHFVKSPH